MSGTHLNIVTILNTKTGSDNCDKIILLKRTHSATRIENKSLDKKLEILIKWHLIY